MDGRAFLGTTDETFDLVIMDAFGSSSIPFHLVTRESFALIRSRLVPSGILAMNVEATAWHDILVHSLAATMQEVFKNVVVLPMAEPPNTLGNLVLLASDRPLELGTIRRYPWIGSAANTTARTRGTIVSRSIPRAFPFSPTTTTPSTSGRSTSIWPRAGRSTSNSIRR